MTKTPEVSSDCAYQDVAQMLCAEAIENLKLLSNIDLDRIGKALSLSARKGCTALTVTPAHLEKVSTVAHRQMGNYERRAQMQ